MTGARSTDAPTDTPTAVPGSAGGAREDVGSRRFVGPSDGMGADDGAGLSARAEPEVPASIASLVGLLSATVQVVADVDGPDRYPVLEEAIAAAAVALQAMADVRQPITVVEESLRTLAGLAADVAGVPA